MEALKETAEDQPVELTTRSAPPAGTSTKPTSAEYADQEIGRRYGADCDLFAWIREEGTHNGPELRVWNKLIHSGGDEGALTIPTSTLLEFLQKFAHEMDPSTILPIVNMTQYKAYDISTADQWVGLFVPNAEGQLFEARKASMEQIFYPCVPTERDRYFTKKVMRSLLLTWLKGSHEKVKGARLALCAHYEKHLQEERAALEEAFAKATFVTGGKTLQRNITLYSPDYLIMYDRKLNCSLCPTEPSHVLRVSQKYVPAPNAIRDTLNDLEEKTTFVETARRRSWWRGEYAESTHVPLKLVYVQRTLKEGCDQAILRTYDGHEVLVTPANYVTTTT